MRLERFWAEQGCLIWQPYNVQVGAGTMNPATFLRVLGPEPWRVAYVEPSARPADGRYAENPNRWQQYYQYQVILKPDPGNPQELYLRSLEAIGVDLSLHDIRFVEDNWESPALGAWGLGWEVWCDGQEISQYTYMQQAGGFTCDPVSVELTYGLERIALFLQGVDTFPEITWMEGITYGDLLRQQEVEHCTYNFQVADVERLQALYRFFEQEALANIDRGLVIPAYDYVLKCSHTFNVLDARGAIGVTERASYFARMRELAHRVAELYLKQREAAGFPLLQRAIWAVGGPAAACEPPGEPPQVPAPLLVEIGTEELPHADLQAALAQLRERMPPFLAELRLAHGRICVEGTPRRLVISVEAVAPRQDDVLRVIKGPPATLAFDAEGRPTKAAEGFARRQGVPLESLRVAEIDGGQYLVAERKEQGLPASLVLSEGLPRLLGSLRFAMSMRWNSTNVAFSRPIRWVVALLGSTLIPFSFAGVPSGRSTRLLRDGEGHSTQLSHAAEYAPLLAEHGIVLSPEERQRLIAAQAQELAASVGGQIREDAELLAEVADLVEAPVAILGSFSGQYLELPEEVLVTVMRKHQRYFAVEKEGKLLPHFVAICNGRKRSLEAVRHGYEAVLRARFADAAHFFQQDLGRPLEQLLPRLGTLTFQERLGSMLDKVQRLLSLARELGRALGVPQEDMPLLERSAKLCKADLATQMVVEFTSLQGVMGRIYALRQGEHPRVAQAIFEHYLPRFAGDALPSDRLGLALGLADRLDSLAGLFAAGLEPTGSADPYALRRAASGVVQLLLGWQQRLDLRWALERAASQLPLAASAEVQERILDFIVQRLRVQLLEKGYRYDVVDAVLAERGHDPYLAGTSAQELQAWVEKPGWMATLNAYARCLRIVRDVPERYQLEPAELREPASQALYQSYLAHASHIGPHSSVDELLRSLSALVEPINRFFVEVLVMADDEKLRRNRIALVQQVAYLPQGIADLSKLEGF